MLYRRFGQTEQWLSAFSLGSMRLVYLQPERAFAVVEAALQRGINHIETAPSYGSSETQLGHILRQLLESSSSLDKPKLHITTKLTPEVKDIRQSVEGSLTRLGLSQLDQLAIHGLNLPEHLEWALQQGIPGLRALQNEGLIQHIGFSTHGSLDLIQAAINAKEFAFVNLHYYWLNQRNSAALQTALEHDMGVFIISPADKGGMLYQPSARLAQLCQPFSPQEVGYRFLLRDPRVHTLSLGAESLSQLDSALAALEDSPVWEAQGSLLLSRLDEYLRETLGSEMCGQCFACLPCPAGIPIPEVLRLRNLTVGYEMTDFGRYRYNMLGQAGHWFPGEPANACTECGECLPRCPHQLPIPDLLADTHRRLQQDPLRRLWEGEP